MDKRLLTELTRITEEEQRLLNGSTEIDRSLYMDASLNVINSRKLLSSGKLITMRPHTRFVDFPVHTHDYVEMVYICSGRMTHIVNGNCVQMEQGDILLLNQFATHAIQKAGLDDIAVNFIILPEFFTDTISMIGEEETPLRRFLVECLCHRDSGPGYLHYQVTQVQTIQNLVENLILALQEKKGSKRRISSLTMTLLFLQLIDHTENLFVTAEVDAAVVKVLQYIDTNYATGSLADISRKLGYDVAWISREIKRKTGKNYTQIVQDKRMAQAAFLLRNTDINVADISVSVGYENVSYFHRLFSRRFGCSPKSYRDQ